VRILTTRRSRALGGRYQGYALGMLDLACSTGGLTTNRPRLTPGGARSFGIRRGRIGGLQADPTPTWGCGYG